MKTKGVVLALVAIVFAAGSAFTMKSAAAEDAYIKIKRVGIAGYVCTNTEIECENTGSQSCRIKVQLATVPTTYKTVNAWKSGCTTELKNSSSEELDFSSSNVEDVQGYQP